MGNVLQLEYQRFQRRLLTLSRAIFGVRGNIGPTLVSLRWSDAFFSGNSQVAAVGLNPVLFLYDTLKVGQAQFDEATVRKHYPQIAEYLGVDQPDPQQLNFTREQGVQPYRLQGERPPNVIFVMLESLGNLRIMFAHCGFIELRLADLERVVQKQHRVQAHGGDLAVAGEERITPASTSRP